MYIKLKIMNNKNTRNKIQPIKISISYSDSDSSKQNNKNNSKLSEKSFTFLSSYQSEKNNNKHSSSSNKEEGISVINKSNDSKNNFFSSFSIPQKNNYFTRKIPLNFSEEKTVNKIKFFQKIDLNIFTKKESLSLPFAKSGINEVKNRYFTPKKSIYYLNENIVNENDIQNKKMFLFRDVNCFGKNLMNLFQVKTMNLSKDKSENIISHNLRNKNNNIIQLKHNYCDKGKLISNNQKSNFIVFNEQYKIINKNERKTKLLNQNSIDNKNDYEKNNSLINIKIKKKDINNNFIIKKKLDINNLYNLNIIKKVRPNKLMRIKNRSNSDGKYKEFVCKEKKKKYLINFSFIYMGKKLVTK